MKAAVKNGMRGEIRIGPYQRPVGCERDNVLFVLVIDGAIGRGFCSWLELFDTPNHHVILYFSLYVT